MERIVISLLIPKRILIGESEKTYYLGKINEQNGSDITRDVDFIFDSFSGKRIIAIDRTNHVACRFIDESISIRDVREGQVVESDIYGFKTDDEAVHFVSILD